MYGEHRSQFKDEAPESSGFRAIDLEMAGHDRLCSPFFCGGRAKPGRNIVFQFGTIPLSGRRKMVASLCDPDRPGMFFLGNLAGGQGRLALSGSDQFRLAAFRTRHAGGIGLYPVVFPAGICGHPGIQSADLWHLPNTLDLQFFAGLGGHLQPPGFPGHLGPNRAMHLSGICSASVRGAAASPGSRRSHCCIRLGLQHIALPLTFDMRFMLFRFLSFLPLAVVMTLICLRTRRLIPFIVAHWLVDMLGVLTGLILPMMVK
jgi:hypothetical protein